MKSFSPIHLLWLLPITGLSLILTTGNMWFMTMFTPGLLLIAALSIIGDAKRNRQKIPCIWSAWAGLGTTMIGDYFLAVRHSPLDSPGFIYGVAGFSLAQTLWIAFFARNYKINCKLWIGLLICIGIFLSVRIFPSLPSSTLGVVLGIYTFLSITSMAFACGSNSRSFAAGIGMLLFSDTMIAYGYILKIPFLGDLVGITYLGSMVLITVAIITVVHPLPRLHRHDKINYIHRASLLTYSGAAIAVCCFALGAHYFPNGGYNPLTYMLSYLGRTHIRDIDHPLCSYFFAAGMFVSAGTIAYFVPAFNCFTHSRVRHFFINWGFVLNTSGLMTIAFIPENVNSLFHNVGCILAAGGGGVAAIAITINNGFSRMSPQWRYTWCSWLLITVAVFEYYLGMHAIRRLPFSPYVPTCQKIVIASFILWLFFHAYILLRDTHAFARKKTVIVLVATVLGFLAVIVPILACRFL